MKEFFLRNKKVVKARKHDNYHRQRSSQSNPYLQEIIRLRKTLPKWDSFFNGRSVEDRDNDWIRLEVLGQPLTEKYAWAIPDERSLRILENFSPLIEIGSGKGYWANLLQQRGVDIVPYDIEVHPNSWTVVTKGGPEMLSRKSNVGRTLFLCYPDEAHDMSVDCLRHYEGDYIVHVGELLVTGTLSGFPQAPFGRTTSSEFSVTLAEHFHCVLSACLPRFPFSNDCITVWKRTNWVKGRTEMVDDDGSGEDDVEQSAGRGGADGSEEGGGDEDEEEGLWADIPANERMPQDRAAPCMEHLLQLR